MCLCERPYAAFWGWLSWYRNQGEAYKKPRGVVLWLIKDNEELKVDRPTGNKENGDARYLPDTLVDIEQLALEQLALEQLALLDRVDCQHWVPGR